MVLGWLFVLVYVALSGLPVSGSSWFLVYRLRIFFFGFLVFRVSGFLVPWFSGLFDFRFFLGFANGFVVLGLVTCTLKFGVWLV